MDIIKKYQFAVDTINVMLISKNIKSDVSFEPTTPGLRVWDATSSLY